MFPRDPGPRPTSLFSVPVWAPALAALVLLTGMSAFATWLALKFDAARPQVGDMIVFVPSEPESDTWQLRVSTTAVAGRDALSGPCVFDPRVLAVHGGSLIVEARDDASPPRFRVHWAGTRTAKGSGDCGAAADMTLDRYDLRRLANVAGGFGAKPTAIR